MPVYEIKAPNGRVYTISGPPNATDAQIRKKILAQYPEAAKPGPPRPRTRGTGIGAVDAVLDNINEILIGVPKGAYDLAAMVTDPISGMIFGKDAVKKAQTQRRNVVDKVSRNLVTKPRPVARLVGETVGPGGLVTGTAKTLARLAPKIPKIGKTVAKVLESTARGGIGVRGASRPETVALKVAGGGTSGAATAAAMGENPEEIAKGFMYGAGLPVLGTIIRKLGGKTIDLTRMPAVKAGKIIREALGKDIDAARAALANLSPDDQRLAQQVMIDAGVEPSKFFGIGKIVAREIDPDTPAAILAAEKAARDARMAGISGGETATAQRAAAQAGRRAVSTSTGPARDAALTRANIAGETVPSAEALANAARQQANEQSGLARRMVIGSERAETTLGQMDDLGDVLDPQAINRQRGIAGSMGQRGEAAAQEAIGLRQQARDMEDVVADLAAEGMTPLRVGPIVGQLRSMAGQPGTRADELQRGALTKLADKLEGLADPNGVIDARDLYQIRKTGLNDIVDTLLSGRQPGSGTKERTASLLTSARKMIDDAVEGAGGKGWKDYLVRTRQGFETVNRQKLAGKGAELAADKPNEFIALMGGKRPDVVEDIMGTGQYDIAGMALSDPKRYNTMRQASDELERLNRMNELSSLGETAGGNLLTKEQPGYLSRGIRAVVGAKFPAVAFAGQGANQIQRAIMSPKVQQKVAQAYQSGPNMANAMNELPTATRISEQMQNVDPMVRNVMAQAPRQLYDTSTDRQRAEIAAKFNVPEFHPDTGEPLIDVSNNNGVYGYVYGRVPDPFTSYNKMRR
jgi:hypothetical protein